MFSLPFSTMTPFFPVFFFSCTDFGILPTFPINLLLLLQIVLKAILIHATLYSRMQHLSCIYTYSMVQSPSWAANWFAASQEIPRNSRNPKVHYRTHKRPPPVSILGQPNPVHIPTSHLLEIHPNIIHPSTPRSPQWSPSLRFPHQDPIHHPFLTHTRHMPNPSHSSRFYHPHNIGWGVQICIYLIFFLCHDVCTTKFSEKEAPILGAMSTPSCWRWNMWMCQTRFCLKPSCRPYLFCGPEFDMIT